jgi:hypothetical protein
MTGSWFLALVRFSCIDTRDQVAEALRRLLELEEGRGRARLIRLLKLLEPAGYRMRLRPRSARISASAAAVTASTVCSPSRRTMRSCPAGCLRLLSVWKPQAGDGGTWNAATASKTPVALK